MKNTVILILFLMITAWQGAYSQRTYTITSGEWIYSFAVIENNGSDKGNKMRYSPFFNFQHFLHIDAARYFGFYTGFAVRNVGFIYEDPATSVKKKYRTYNIGIPVGLKLGNTRRACLFAGYELELPVNYKEKTFIDERKVDKFNVWFSRRTPELMHSVIGGIQFSRTTSVKFKYYLTGFFNRTFQSTDQNGVLIKPFENFNARVFYFSLDFTIFRNRKFNRTPLKKIPVYEAYQAVN